jgi:hypothetical protein
MPLLPCYICAFHTTAVDNAFAFDPPLCHACWFQRQEAIHHARVKGCCLSCGDSKSIHTDAALDAPMCEACVSERDDLLQPYREEFEDQLIFLNYHLEIGAPALFRPTLTPKWGSLLRYVTMGAADHLDDLNKPTCALSAPPTALTVDLLHTMRDGLFLIVTEGDRLVVYDAWNRVLLSNTADHPIITSCRETPVRDLIEGVAGKPRETIRVLVYRAHALRPAPPESSV